jgi:hypothetical protein
MGQPPAGTDGACCVEPSGVGHRHHGSTKAVRDRGSEHGGKLRRSLPQRCDPSSKDRVMTGGIAGEAGAYKDRTPSP